MLTKADYKSALDVQSACNLQAVINSLHRLMPRIAEECNGTDEINRHPIVRLYAEQIYHLATGDYFPACDECEEKSK